jgi:TolB protein
VNGWHPRIAARSLTGWVATFMMLSALWGCGKRPTAPPPQPSAVLTAPVLSPTAALSHPSGTQEELILSMEENGYAHLFAYSLSTSELRRLTSGQWSDVTPSLSPDGKDVAFASNRGGYWDIYKLELQTAQVTQLTDSPTYDSAPTWSPDLAWLAYETYEHGHLDIAIRSLTDPSQVPIYLTDDAAADHSPAWAPNGRQIAFVSSRSGDSDVWLADLNSTQDRLVDLSNSPGLAENHPIWTSDGGYLAWAAAVPSPGYAGIYVWDATAPERAAVWTANGQWAAWNAAANQIVIAVDGPNSQLLGAYGIDGRPLMLPFPLPGRLRGLVWPALALPEPLPQSHQSAANETVQPVTVAAVTPVAGVPSQRWYLVPLQNVQAPSAQLHALVEPSFDALRQRVVAELGWDALASLESTFLPLTTPLDPGLGEDWLFTGRAFAINSLMANAGWMSVAREDIGAETYWRIYLRTQKQDGSQGIPMPDPPWDLNARYDRAPQSYEAGGSYADVPSGYWIDFTSLAAAYGWERLPSLPNWRSYFAGTRFTEFALTGGLDWYSAMLQLYPVEAFLTATPVLPPTATPTRTPRPTATPSPTLTASPTFTATLSPTPRPPTDTPGPTSTPPTIIPAFPSPTP